MIISTSSALITSLHHYGDKTDLTKCIKLVKDAGFCALDLSLYAYCQEGMPMTNDSYKDWAYGVKEIAERCGITFNQTHGDALSGMYWDDPDYSYRKGFTERNLRCVETTKILGAKWMVVHPYNLPHDPLYNKEKAKEANIRYLTPIIEHAKKHGVGIAIENMIDFGRNRRRYCGGDPYELIELADYFNDSAVGICIDTGHANQAGVNVGEFIRLAGNRLKATHIDDNMGDKDSHVLPFYGNSDWTDIVKALKDINYQNDFSFELCYVKMPEAATPAWLSFIYKLGESLIK